uniref:Uncharacterized protein n=1 Tax=Anopheles dirus TaxID=7168 RepID=A0A182N717_9DIPT
MYRITATAQRWSILLLLTLVTIQLYAVPVQVMYEQLQQLNGTELIDGSNIRIRKYNRTLSVMNGTFDLFRNVDNNFSFTFRLAYSALGNNQFVQSPVRLPMQRMCHFLNTTYSDYWHFYANVTNFPAVGECPVQAKRYYVRDKTLDSTLFLQDYLKSGLWKITMLVYEQEVKVPVAVGI